MGLTTQAVPVPKSSSSYRKWEGKINIKKKGENFSALLTRPWLSSSVTCGMVKVASRTLNLPHWRVMANMESRVMPGRMRPFSGGVISSCSTDEKETKGS